MTSTLTQQQLDEIETAIATYRRSHDHPTAFACCSAHPVADHAEAAVRRLSALTLPVA